MNNTVRKNRCHKRGHKTPAQSCELLSNISQNGTLVNLFILYVLFHACTAILTSGCNESLQTTARRPEPAFVGNLVAEATEIIRQALEDRDALIRVNAIEVIATTKQIRLMPKVQRMLRDKSPWVRFAAALAVGDLQFSLAKREVAQLSKDDNENLRIAAAYAMGRLGSADSFEVLREAVASPDLQVRANAVMLLGKSGDKSPLTRRSLWWALGRKDSDDKVRFQAAEAIAMLGDDLIYPKLWAMLISVYADVRIIGVRAVGALGTTDARTALITVLNDDVLEVRLAAAEQLGMLGNPAGESVVLDVFKKNLTAGLRGQGLERVRAFTAMAIGHIGTPPLKKFLPRLLTDQSKSVRIAAARAVFQTMVKSRSLEKSAF